MTLKEAYDKWSVIQENKRLAMSYLSPARKCLLEKHGEVKLEIFTDSYIETIFSTCKESKEMKARAASLLQQILKWVTDYKVDPDYEETSFERNGLPKAQPVTGPVPDDALKTGAVRMKSKVVSQKSKKEKKAKPARKGKSVPVRKATGVLGRMIREMKNSEENATAAPKVSEARGGHRTVLCRPVLQVDPVTYKVVGRYESAANASREFGANNIGQYARKHQICKGFYWVYEDEFSDGWAPAARSRSEEPVPTLPVVTVFPDQKKLILSRFSDDELIDELIERGWEGDITITKSRQLKHPQS